MLRPALPKFDLVLRTLAVCTVCLLAVFAAQFVHAAPDEPAAPGSIAGVVRAADSATPLPGIRIDVYAFSGSIIRSVTTDANGAYRAPVLPAGVYLVAFTDPAGLYATQYYSGALSFSAATDLPVLGQDVTGIDAALSLGGSISGTVTQENLPGLAQVVVQVRLYGRTGDRWDYLGDAPVDAASSYSFGPLQPGVYRVCATFWGQAPLYARYDSCHDRVSAGVDAATDVTVVASQTTAGVDIHLGRETDVATLSGTVTDPDGAPLAGVEVVAQAIDAWSSMSVHTDASGHYTHTWLPADTYRIRFSDLQGFGMAEYYDNAAAALDAAVLTLAPNEVRNDVDAELAQGGRITGVVTLLGEVQPVYATVQVLAENSPYQSIASVALPPGTDHYVLGGLPPGRYKVGASASFNPPVPGQPAVVYPMVFYGGGYDLISASVITVTAGGTVGNIDFIYGVGAYDGVLQGVVTAGGAPAANVRVELFVGSEGNLALLAYVMTGADGSYRFEGLPSQQYWPIFRDPTLLYAPVAPSPLYVVSGAEPVILDAQLSLAGAISGQVRRRDGSLATNGYVYVSQYPSLSLLPYYSVANVQDGAYRLRGLAAGDYRVCATIDGFFACHGEFVQDGAGYPVPGYPIMNVRVASGQETTGIDISLEPPRRAYLPTVQRE